jgi:universal stress protein E
MARSQIILVAVKNPGARKQVAIRKAVQIAAATGARLTLFHAITAALYVDAFALQGMSLQTVQKQWKDRVLKSLERQAAPLRDEGLQVDTACEWDSPAYEAVVRRAARVKADMIVAERHATRHLLPTLLRFNDWELLRRSPVPVLLVKNSKPYKRPTLLAAIDPSHSFAKPAKLDARIVAEVERLSHALQGSAHVVHAYPGGLAASDPFGNVPPQMVTRIERQVVMEARKGFATALEGSTIGKSRRHLIAGHAIDVIPRLAKKQRTSIVVMGAISRSGFKRLIIGNIAEQVLDALSCDVLVIKPDNFKPRVSALVRDVPLLATPSFMT